MKNKAFELGRAFRAGIDCALAMDDHWITVTKNGEKYPVLVGGEPSEEFKRKWGRAKKPTANKARADEIDKSHAERSFRNTTHFPERHGERVRQEYARRVNDLYDRMLAKATTPEAKQWLEQNFDVEKQRILSAYNEALSAEGRAASSAIVGGDAMRGKGGDLSHFKKWADVDDQFRKCEERLTRGVEHGYKTKEQKQEFAQQQKLKEFTDTLNNDYFSKDNFYGKLLTQAKYGNVELVNKVLEETKKAGYFTPRHKIWKLGEFAQKWREYREAKKNISL